MIKKLVSYILSRRRARKLKDLRALHKMPVNRIERAIRACELAAEIVYEPALKQRIDTLISVKSPSYIILYRELELVRNCARAQGDGKYLTPPEWVLYEKRAVSMDEYFKTETSYIGIKPAIYAILALLKEIGHELKQDYNLKFAEYYCDKPHRIYSEVYELMLGVSENV